VEFILKCHEFSVFFSLQEQPEAVFQIKRKGYSW